MMIFDGAARRIVETVGHGLMEPAHRSLAHNFGLASPDVVRIVEDHAITAFARTDTANRRRQFPAGLMVGHLLVAGLCAPNSGGRAMKWSGDNISAVNRSLSRSVSREEYETPHTADAACPSRSIPR